MSDSKQTKSHVFPATPNRARRNLQNGIAKMVVKTDSDYSTDGSDFQPTESGSDTDENSSDTDDSEPTPRKKAVTALLPIISQLKKRSQPTTGITSSYVPQSDDYFHTFTSKKLVTSDHTLAQLRNFRIPANEISDLLSKASPSIEHECKIGELSNDCHLDFSKWCSILEEGFNLLVYGLGSKRQLLQRFHEQELSNQIVLVVNGFFPSITVRDILDSISKEILVMDINSANPHEAVVLIENELVKFKDTHFYIIINNLDGVMLRNDISQSVISRLSKVKNIHVIASVDHINTPLLWDQTILCNFNFMWWDCTTMLPYAAETAYESSLFVQNSTELCLSSMRSVFESLTSNSRGIFMVIVKHQLKNQGSRNYQGIAFKDLYWSCREQFLVSSDVALRAQMTEFLDHKLVKSKRSIDGTEQIIIPIEYHLLQDFLEDQNKLCN